MSETDIEIVVPEWDVTFTLHFRTKATSPDEIVKYFKEWIEEGEKGQMRWFITQVTHLSMTRRGGDKKL